MIRIHDSRVTREELDTRLHGLCATEWNFKGQFTNEKGLLEDYHCKYVWRTQDPLPCIVDERKIVLALNAKLETMPDIVPIGTIEVDP